MIIIYDLLKEVLKLYVEMAPFLFIGLSFAGLLYLLFNQDFIAKHIGGNNILSVIKSALFGVPLPLCSCGVIPTALHLHNQKASKSATISFLISTPQTGIDSIIATYGLMGPVFAIFRPLVALITGITGGIVNILFGKEDKRENIQTSSCQIETKKRTFLQAFKYAFVDFLDDISLRLLFGIVVAGLISYFIPDNFFQDKITNPFVGMLLMILFGLPLYVCATGSIPIAVSLMMKGVSPGAAFVFLMVGPATNIATVILIAKSLGKKTVFLYLLTIIISALFFGTLLNFIFKTFDINPLLNLNKMNMTNLTILSIPFTIFMVLSVFRKIKPIFAKGEKIKMEGKRFKILGMTCNHCVKHVTEAILKVKGVTDAIVSLNEKQAVIKGNFLDSDIIECVEKAGYKAVKD